MQEWKKSSNKQTKGGKKKTEPKLNLQIMTNALTPEKKSVEKSFRMSNKVEKKNNKKGRVQIAFFFCCDHRLESQLKSSATN